MATSLSILYVLTRKLPKGPCFNYVNTEGYFVVCKILTKNKV